MAAKKLCIYCGNLSNTRDHVPPRCFYKIVGSPNLITVPCCAKCNKFYDEEVDVLARNTLISLYKNEPHWAISQELGEKRNRSFRAKSKIIRHMSDIMVTKEVLTPEGVFIGIAPALRLDNRVMDLFFEKLVKGLIYCAFGIRLESCAIKWGLVSHLVKDLGDPAGWLPVIGPPVVEGNIGDETFVYYGWGERDETTFFWIVQFYGGEEFYILV